MGLVAKYKKHIKYALMGVVGLILVGCLNFYVFVVSGLVQTTQELWVTTAMTTLNHKWLATAFINEDTVNAILERTRVADEEFLTDNSKLDFVESVVDENVEEIAEEVEEEPVDTYVEEGYELLEDGIYFKNVSGTGWKGYLLLVTNPSRVSLAQTRYQFERGDLVKTLVPHNNARVGVNAGGFVDGPNYDSNGGTPAGLLIVDGELINHNGSKKHSVIGFNTDNKLILGKMTKDEAIEANLRDAVDFKPFLIVNGETVIKEGQGGWGIAPRTAVGQRQTGEVIFLCVDGRQAHSIGTDLRQLQDTLFEEGCINAGMVDGGSSTVMYHADKGYLNKPSLGHERYINNCWIVK